MNEKQQRTNATGKTKETKRAEQAERTKKSKEGKSPISFDVYEEDKNELKRLATENGESIAEYITKAVNERAKKKILRIMPKRGKHNRQQTPQE